MDDEAMPYSSDIDAISRVALRIPRNSSSIASGLASPLFVGTTCGIEFKGETADVSVVWDPPIEFACEISQL